MPQLRIERRQAIMIGKRSYAVALLRMAINREENMEFLHELGTDQRERL